VHDVLHQNAKVNYAFGVFLAAFFPTGFTFQRYCHLGHHQRNRSYAEQFDYYRPTDNRVLRYLQWYGILTGLYWCLAPVTTLLYLLVPGIMTRIINQVDQSHAWSELDVINGAWNLRINPLVQALFLNYHHHRAHHQNPRVSWRHLHSLIDQSKPRPSFLRIYLIYLMMWKGPRPIAEHKAMYNKVLTKCC
jgi:fatty acid desaturase